MGGRTEVRQGQQEMSGWPTDNMQRPSSPLFNVDLNERQAHGKCHESMRLGGEVRGASFVEVDTNECVLSSQEGQKRAAT